MKRYFILLFLILGSLCLNAQTYDPYNLDPKPMLTESAAIGTAKKTTETATSVKYSYRYLL